MAEVNAVNQYDGFVLGSAIHGGKWLPDAARFIDTHRADLSSRAVWLFGVSTLGDEESMFPPAVARRLRAMRKDTPEITAFRAAIGPRGHRNFAGAIAPSYWHAVGRTFFRATGGRYGDHRNWPAIDAWTDTIATVLTPPASQRQIAHRAT